MSNQTKKRVPTVRELYSNYDLTIYDDDIKDMYGDDITEEQLWEERYFNDRVAWEEFKGELESFFDSIDNEVIFVGTVGRWDGNRVGGMVGDFKELFASAITDCDYIEFKDVNGHLYLRCSHHDGTNEFEIKIVTDRGTDYYDRWDGYDNRTEQEVHWQIFQRYSRLPHFAHKVWGCPKVQWEKGE